MSDTTNDVSLTDVSYWQNVYRMELEHFEEFSKQKTANRDHNDTEDTENARKKYEDDYLIVENEWFGDKVSFALIDWAKRAYDCDYAVPIIDLGCGQAALLNKLAKTGFIDLTGVDFSNNAIDLARKLATKNNHQITLEKSAKSQNNMKKLEAIQRFCLSKALGIFRTASTEAVDVISGILPIRFSLAIHSARDDLRINSHTTFLSHEITRLVQSEVVDLMDIKNSSKDCMKRRYSIVIDKGTYDAITLKATTSDTNHAKYVQTVKQLLANGKSFFVITSCNFTSSELKTKFADDFNMIEEIKCNQIFYFANRGGRVNTTVVFARK